MVQWWLVALAGDNSNSLFAQIFLLKNYCYCHATAAVSSCIEPTIPTRAARTQSGLTEITQEIERKWAKHYLINY